MPHIVQFTHPGSEHGPDPKNGSSHKSWNTGRHLRKFMRASGDYVTASSDLRVDQPLQFWGEWEPPSEVETFDQCPDQYYPRWLHHPYLPKSIPSGGASLCAPHENSCKSACAKMDKPQNTDPFVFGDCFKYFICKQIRKYNINENQQCWKATGMANLARGSMILFGSCIDINKSTPFFQLDTVFIVADGIDYNPSDKESLKNLRNISPLYYQMAISKEFPKPTHHSINLKLYRGATFADQVDGMYSFSPARVSKGEPAGFPRVKLQGMEFLSNKLQNLKKTPCATIKEVRLAWTKIREQSRKQGCVEGVRFSIPNEDQRRTSARN